jgi:hypothetical protein
MAGIFASSGWCVVAVCLTNLLELVEFRLLIFREMREMPRGILHRLDSLEIGHVRDAVGML